MHDATKPASSASSRSRFGARAIAGGFSVDSPGATHVTRESVAIADCWHRERRDNPLESVEPFSIAIMEAGGNISARKAGLAVHQVALPRHGSDAARCSSRRTNA